MNCKFCLFVLRLNVPVNNFSVMSGRNELKMTECSCNFQGKIDLDQKLTCKFVLVKESHKNKVK